MIKTEKNQTSKVTDEVDQLVQRSKKALAILKSYTQAQIDDLCEKVAVAALDNHMKLAKLAVEETGRGVVEDKAIKNIYASEYIWNSMRHDKTVGVIKEDDEEQLMEIAEPVGIVAGVTPVTNPTSTTVFKT
ncbi:aldehyde dehydrogenase family protein, partial [Latilactobacillus sakei]